MSMKKFMLDLFRHKQTQIFLFCQEHNDEKQNP
jgi:hypothetical protein